MSKDLHNDEEITIDLLEIANILKRNAGNIARVTGIFVVAAGVYLATATPVYESQALLRVKQPKGIGTSLDGLEKRVRRANIYSNIVQ